MYLNLGLNFHFNSEFSLLELLCTLTRLCKGTPHSHSLAGQQGEQVSQSPWAQSSYSSLIWAQSTPQPSHPHDITPQTIYHLSTAKVISTTCRTISCAAFLWMNLSLVFCETFSQFTQFFPHFAIFSTGEGGGG